MPAPILLGTQKQENILARVDLRSNQNTHCRLRCVSTYTHGIYAMARFPVTVTAPDIRVSVAVYAAGSAERQFFLVETASGAQRGCYFGVPAAYAGLFGGRLR